MSGSIVPVVVQGIVIDEHYLDELEALIVEIQQDNYASPLAQDLLKLESEIVVWQYRNFEQASFLLER